jgi:hypothetical protein
MTSDPHDVYIPASVPNPAALGQRVITYELPSSFLESGKTILNYTQSTTSSNNAH